MNRIETALREGRCVIVFGNGALQDPQVVDALRERQGLPLVRVTEDEGLPGQALSVDALAPVQGNGGLLVLVGLDPVADRAVMTAIDGHLRGHKPRLLAVAKGFNMMVLPAAMRLWKQETLLKLSPREFSSALPIPADAPARLAPAEEARKAAQSSPNILFFIGREEEIATLTPLIQAGGPVALVGPPGIGKRTLIERIATQTEGLSLLPELNLVRGVGFDTLAARLAEISGDEGLQKMLQSTEQRPEPQALVDRIITALEAPQLSGQVFPLGQVNYHQHRDGSLYSDGRLAMLLKALLTRRYALSVVFCTTVAPQFYREGEGRPLKVVNLEGLKGRELYQIFDAVGAGDITRDKMGEVHNRTMGHPIATRMFAVAWRQAENKDEHFENKRFLKLERDADGQWNLEALKRVLMRRLEKLPEELRSALALVAHAPEPVSTDLLSKFGLTRAHRQELLAMGLMEALSDRKPRHLYVHPFIAGMMDRREISVFDGQEKLAELLMEEAKEKTGVALLAHQQLAWRLLVSARRNKGKPPYAYIDQEPLLESIQGLVRGQNPRWDIAEPRVNEGLNNDPNNLELYLMKAEVLSAMKADRQKIMEVYQQAIALGPTPEVYHHHASWVQEKRKEEAAKALEAGIARFGDNARLRRRLAGIYRGLGRLEEAAQLLREAQDLEPMMPDTYSALGQVYTELNDLARAEEVIRESIRLDPNDPIHHERLGTLLHKKGMLHEAEREALWTEAQTHLDEAIKHGARSGHAHLALAVLLLDRMGAQNKDLDRVEWLLREAKDVTRQPQHKYARLRLYARKGDFARAEEGVEALQKTSNTEHGFQAARGEFHAFQSQIFKAAQAFGEAVKLSEGRPEQALYRLELARLEELITSGEAVRIEKEAEAIKEREELERKNNLAQQRAAKARQLAEKAAREADRKAKEAERLAQKLSATQHQIAAQADDGAAQQVTLSSPVPSSKAPGLPLLSAVDTSAPRVSHETPAQALEAAEEDLPVEAEVPTAPELAAVKVEPASGVSSGVDRDGAGEVAQTEADSSRPEEDVVALAEAGAVIALSPEAQRAMENDARRRAEEKERRKREKQKKAEPAPAPADGGPLTAFAQAFARLQKKD